MDVLPTDRSSNKTLITTYFKIPPNESCAKSSSQHLASPSPISFSPISWTWRIIIKKHIWQRMFLVKFSIKIIQWRIFIEHILKAAVGCWTWIHVLSWAFSAVMRCRKRWKFAPKGVSLAVMGPFEYILAKNDCTGNNFYKMQYRNEENTSCGAIAHSSNKNVNMKMLRTHANFVDKCQTRH